MSKDHADLIARADEQLAKSHPWLAQGYVPIIRDLRDALAEAEADRCDNPLSLPRSPV